MSLPGMNRYYTADLEILIVRAGSEPKVLAAHVITLV